MDGQCDLGHEQKNSEECVHKLDYTWIFLIVRRQLDLPESDNFFILLLANDLLLCCLDKLNIIGRDSIIIHWLPGIQ